GQLPHRADHLRMPGMANQDHMAPEPVMANRLLVNLGDQRTGGVEIKQVAVARIGRHGFRHAMGRKHDGAMAMLHRDFTKFLDEDGAPLLQAFNHIAVVHDLVAHIDRSPVLLQRKHNDLDRPIHTRTKAPRPTKTYGQLWLVTIQGHYLKSPVTRGRWRL